MPHHLPEWTITREDHTDGSGQLVLTRSGVRLGTLDYRCDAAGPLYIDFVEVVRAAQGAGLGRRLVEAAVAWARESRTTIVPLCSYSRSVIEGDAVLKDILD